MHIPERDVLVFQLLQSSQLCNVRMGLTTASIFVQNPALLVVLEPHPQIGRCHIDGAEREYSQHGAMAAEIARWVSVDARSHDGEWNPKNFRESTGSATLGEAGSVDGEPDR